MRDPMAPPAAGRPAEAVELVCLAVSDGGLEAALAQYEAGAVLRPWARDPGGDTAGVADALIQLMGLRLPLAVRIRAIGPGDGLALVAGEWHIAGTGPDCEPVQLSGAGATVVRRQPGGSRRIAADAWCLVPGRAGRRPGTQLIPGTNWRWRLACPVGGHRQLAFPRCTPRAPGKPPLGRGQPV